MRVTCCLLLCFSYCEIFSQNRQSPDYTEVKGVLIDTLTSLPISSVHIWTNHFRTISDPDGSFSILTLPNDSLHFSHISYERVVISCNPLKNISPLKIFMKQKIMILKEVDIYNILTEEQFKQKILDTTPEETKEEQNAKVNMATLNYYMKSLPPVEMNANENYREYMKGPQGVTIFSTSKQKGLIKAIRDVIKTKPMPYKSFSNRSSTVTDLKFNVLKDSSAYSKKLKMDSLESTKHNKK